ncbi:MAG: hypothetical protein ACUVTL_09070 [Thermoproteota archaeon]
MVNRVAQADPFLNVVATVIIPVYALFVDTRVILLMLVIFLFTFVLLFLNLHPYHSSDRLVTCEGFIDDYSSFRFLPDILVSDQDFAYTLVLSSAYVSSIYFLLKSDEAEA